MNIVTQFNNLLEKSFNIFLKNNVKVKVENRT